MYTFVPNKPIGQLHQQISSRNFVFLKTSKSEFQEIDIWFTDQNSQPLEMEDRINLTLVIKYIVIIKMRYSIEADGRIYVKGYGFLSFAKKIGTHATKVAKNEQ